MLPTRGSCKGVEASPPPLRQVGIARIANGHGPPSVRSLRALPSRLAATAKGAPTHLCSRAVFLDKTGGCFEHYYNSSAQFLLYSTSTQFLLWLFYLSISAYYELVFLLDTVCRQVAAYFGQVVHCDRRQILRGRTCVPAVLVCIVCACASVPVHTIPGGPCCNLAPVGGP